MLLGSRSSYVFSLKSRKRGSSYLEALTLTSNSPPRSAEEHAYSSDVGKEFVESGQLIVSGSARQGL